MNGKFVRCPLLYSSFDLQTDDTTIAVSEKRIRWSWFLLKLNEEDGEMTDTFRPAQTGQYHSVPPSKLILRTALGVRCSLLYRSLRPSFD